MARSWLVPARLREIARPPVPPSGNVDLYARDGRLRAQSSDGTERVVGTADLVVGPTNTLSGPGVWWQVLPGGALTAWVEDGAS